MTPTSSPAHLVQPETTAQWVLSSAVILTFATVVGSVLAFVLIIFVPGPASPFVSSSTQVSAFLLQSQLVNSFIIGLSFGISIGFALAMVGEGFVPWAAWKPGAWTLTTISSVSLGVIAATFLQGFSLRVLGTSVLGALAAGALAGLLIGVAQSFVLWRAYEARMRWIIVQICAFGLVMVVFGGAQQHVSELWLFPMIWLSMWGIYSWIIGAAVNNLVYRYSNNE
jgi:hypothetical protein